MSKRSEESETLESPTMNMPLDQRIDLAEAAVGEVLNSLESIAIAINRLETFVFPLIKTLNDRGALTIEEWEKCRKELEEYDNLYEYWTNGKKAAPPADPEAPDNTH